MDFVPFLICVAIIAVAVAVITAIIVKSRKNRTSGYGPKRAASTSETTDTSIWDSTKLSPADLEIGDWVDIGETYEVKARLDFTEGKYAWVEYWLKSPRSKVWLSVEKDQDELEVIHWSEVPMDNKLKPGSKKFMYKGAEYRLDDDGEANYRSTGPTDLPDSGTCEYFDYKADDGNLLSFERFDGDEWEMAEGFNLGSDWASIIPGAKRSASK